MKELSRKINFSNQTLADYLYRNNKKEADYTAKILEKLSFRNGLFENGSNW